jgi:cytochrome c oxidase subunit 3
MAKSKNSIFPLVDPSPWPLLGGVAALLLGIGLVLFMHQKGCELLFLGAGVLLWVFWGWWRDMLKEANAEAYTPLVERVLRGGFVLFILSETMFFVAFFWAFLDVSLLMEQWPPQGIRLLDPLEWPYLNTVILLLSGTSLTWAHHSLLRHDNKSLVWGLGGTIGLGVLFSLIQGWEYLHATFGFREGIYPSVFYMATGFHGLHVLIGIGFLGFCFWRARQGLLDSRHHVAFEAACWYWQFVDVVWLFIFVIVYLWGGG